MHVIRVALAELASQPIEKAARRLVAIAIQVHRVNPRLQRFLAEQIARIRRLANVDIFGRADFARFRRLSMITAMNFA
jgi:hypothetical protein